MKEVLEVTEERNKWIQHAGYNLKVMRECEWHLQKKTDPEIEDFVKELKIQDPLVKGVAIGNGGEEKMRRDEEGMYPSHALRDEKGRG